MNRSQVTHLVVSAIKYLSVFTGFAAYAHFIPGELGVVAVLVFGLASAVKDTLSGLEKRLESGDSLVNVTADTVKDSAQVLAKAEDVMNAVKPAPRATLVKK